MDIGWWPGRRPSRLAAALVFLLLPGFSGGAIEHPALGAPRGATASAEPSRVVISLEGRIPAALGATLAAAGAELIRVDPVLSFAVARTPDPEHLAATLDLPVERDVPARIAGHAGGGAPSDPRLGDQWALDRLAMRSAWPIETGSGRVSVAVVDSGIAPHTDLDPDRIEWGYDFVDGDFEPRDGHGHGTHVAGIIGATTDNGIGIAGMAEVRIVAIRVLDNQGSGWCSDIASGVAYAALRRVDVINLSLYCNLNTLQLSTATQLAWAAGIVVVASAGNHWQSEPARCVNYPAAHDWVIAVAALTESSGVWSGSCRGPEVELTAPGVSILSTVPGNTYQFWTGTSMAAPHVAATAALMRARDRLVTHLAIREILQDTALDIGPAGRDPASGYGLIRPRQALEALDPIVHLPV